LKSIGIVRRIDALGRIVIPVETRRTMNIHDGDALEMFTESEYLCLKKYERYSSHKEILDQLIKNISEDDIKYKAEIVKKLTDISEIFNSVENNAQ
jgi:AbrB family looped-hinge helix DNA binding protein